MKSNQTLLRGYVGPSPNASNNPNPLAAFESAPRAPDLRVKVQYWHHACPLSPRPGGEQYQLFLSVLGRSTQQAGTPCRLDCGHRAHRDSELCNYLCEPVELVGGKNLLPGRLESWWMRCSRCGATSENYLEDHPMVKLGIIADDATYYSGARAGGRVATACTSCGVGFTGSALPLNRFGESVSDVKAKDDEYWRSLRRASPSTEKLAEIYTSTAPKRF